MASTHPHGASLASPAAAPHATAGYVLPPAPRGRSPLLIEPEPIAPVAVAELAALRSAGSRMQALLECQQQFFSELRQALAETEAAVHEETRVRIIRQVAQLGEILDWCEAVQGDLVLESRRAAMGWQAVDLAAALRQAAERHETATPVLLIGQSSMPWWGRREDLDRLLTLALRVVSERIGGSGSIHVELGDSEHGHNLRVLGLGEPCPVASEQLIGSFRAAAAAARAVVSPDALGVGGSGFVLRFGAASPSS